MPDANEPQGDCDPAGSGLGPVLISDEVPEGAQLGDDQAEASDDNNNNNNNNNNIYFSL